jgi:arginyl-tRNA synthetase
MYAHTRASSLVARCLDARIQPDHTRARPGPGEQRLAWTIARLQPAVQEATEKSAPQRFAAYALELAGAFNEYYRDHRVLECEDKAVQSMRLSACMAGQAALRKALETLGIPALEEM